MTDLLERTAAERGQIHRFLADPASDPRMRHKVLRQIVTVDTEESHALAQEILDAFANRHADALATAKLAEAEKLLTALRAGPLRSAHVLYRLDSLQWGERAAIVLGDGTTATCAVGEAALSASLQPGDPVFVDAKCQAILGRAPDVLPVGEEARFERTIDERRIEVTHGSDERRLVLHVAASLARQLAAREVASGSKVLICPQRLFAFAAVPAARTLRSTFLFHGPLPEVTLDDIGDPHPFVAETLTHVRTELTAPQLARRYGMRRSRTLLLVGVSGSGKSLHIMALQRGLTELMAEHTGLPLAEVPARTFRLRTSDLLSKWFGESEARIDRAFDEIEQLAAEPVTGADGRAHELPVLVILEEADSLGRARGAGSDTHDRVQGTILQRLDATTQRLRDRLIVFVFSSNVPQLIDPAFLRRAGGQTIRFGRLTRRSFVAVLDKAIRELPFRCAGAGSAAAARTRAIDDVAAWLWAADADPVVEVHPVGAPQPLKKQTRDFLTGALVDRAVQDAAARACQAEQAGIGEPGLDAPRLYAALHDQVRAIVDQLRPDNASEYLTLPEGVRVASVRRLEQPLPAQPRLERAS